MRFWFFPLWYILWLQLINWCRQVYESSNDDLLDNWGPLSSNGWWTSSSWICSCSWRSWRKSEWAGVQNVKIVLYKIIMLNWLESALAFIDVYTPRKVAFYCNKLLTVLIYKCKVVMFIWPEQLFSLLFCLQEPIEEIQASDDEEAAAAEEEAHHDDDDDDDDDDGDDDGHGGGGWGGDAPREFFFWWWRWASPTSPWHWTSDVGAEGQGDASWWCQQSQAKIIIWCSCSSSCVSSWWWLLGAWDRPTSCDETHATSSWRILAESPTSVTSHWWGLSTCSWSRGVSWYFTLTKSFVAYIICK